MNWTELLTCGVEDAYGVATKLMDLVDKDKLTWKPPTGQNWMTTGQVLHHMTNACGATFKGFVTGDWGMPAGAGASETAPEEMLPPAEKLPTVKSVAEAKKLLGEDKKVALAMIKQAGEKRLANDKVKAPWGGPEVLLGHQLLGMIGHLTTHKAQLFYYLKLQGKPVNTGHLWGM